MEKLFVLLVAVALIVLGARGTYKSVWNQYFPNEQIVTTPTSTVGATGSNATGVPAAPGTAGNPKGSSPIKVTPNVTPKAGGKPVTVVTGGGGVYPNQTVTSPQSPTIVTTGIPDWWPGWLPYPFG